jgi:hypothetical protein
MIHQPNEDGWLEHQLRQAPWRTQTQGTSLVMAAVVMVAVIGALYLAQSSRTAAAGRRVQELEAQRQLLVQRNAQLGAEIAALRSVPRLIREAETMGYHAARSDEVEYLVVRGVAQPEEDLVAQAREPEEPAQAAEPVPEYDETLEGWLSARFAEFSVQFATFWEATFSLPEAGEGPEQP